MKPFAALVLSLFAACVTGGEPAAPLPQPPDAPQIAQAVEKGKQIRDQKGLVPGALLKSAVVLKVGDARNGYALVKIEDGRAEGAVYKLTERLKVAMPEGNDMITSDYTGVLLLAADLTLISGRQASTRTVTSNKRTEASTVSAEIFVNGNELSFTRKELKDGQEMLDPKADHKLHGVRPVPRNAIIALAAFAAADPNFNPGVSAPFIVPSMDMGMTIDEFLLQPAWISFELPKDKTKNPDLKMLMTVRFLDGEVNEKGLKIEPPHEVQWNEDAMQWSYDNKMQVLSTPGAGDSIVQTEMADADKLNIDEPIDAEKVRAEVKKVDDKINKQKDKELEELIKNSAPVTPVPPQPQPAAPKPTAPPVSPPPAAPQLPPPGK